MVSLDDPRIRDAYEEPEELERMSFGDHLDELRKRLLRALLALGVCFFAMIPFKEQVQRIIIEPYRILWRAGFADYVDELEQQAAAGELVLQDERDMLAFCREHYDAILDGSLSPRLLHILDVRTGFKLPYELMAVGGVEDFWTFMMASVLFAFVLASPVVIWQLWAFIAAGLYKRERRVFYRYFPFAVGLLAAGVLFGYFLVLPYGLGWLMRLMVDGLVTSMLTVGNYFTFLFAITAAMGLIFQLPVVMLALQRVRLVRHVTFRQKWRYIVLGICVLAAVFTPPDPVSMAMMAGPTIGLYGVGLVLTWFNRKKFEAMDLDEPPAGEAGAAGGGGAR